MFSDEKTKDSPSLKHGSTYYSGAKQVHPHLSSGGPSGERLNSNLEMKVTMQ